MFSKRHYTWLAKFAAANLNRDQCYTLARWLREENTKTFDAWRFLTACNILEKE